jgi:HK97 gp10 family phage protein
MASEIILDDAGFFDGLDLTDEKLNQALEEIVTEGATIIARNAKMMFRPRQSGSQHTSKRTGRIYYTGKGDPPRPTNRTGNLSASIRIRPRGIKQLEPGVWQSKVGTTLYYAPFVEYGTSRMQPYSYMKPAIEASMPEIQELITEQLTAVMEA